MQAGLWLYDNQGRERFGPGVSNVTILGVVDTGQTNGSVTSSEFSKGTPVIISAYALAGSTTSLLPKITRTSNGIFWTFQVSGASGNLPFRIVYGVRA